MDLASLQSLLTAVVGVRVACVGDVMIDRFVYGEVNRTSPEAPVAVLARGRETTMLGGAGNVARNVAALGGLAALTGVIGDDAAANEALGLVGAEPGMEGHLVAERGRPTTVKTRYVAAGQQLLRVDSEDARPARARCSTSPAPETPPWPPWALPWPPRPTSRTRWPSPCWRQAWWSARQAPR